MPPSRRALLAPFAWAMATALHGCSDSSGPLGKGDVIHVDVDASAAPAAGSSSGGEVLADSAFAPQGGPYGSLPDAYAPLARCSQCACAAGTFCYGGSPSSGFSACDQTLSSAPPYELGCHALPAACDGGVPDCVCVLEALAKPGPCYPVCEPARTGPPGGLVVYCPN